MSRRNGRFGHKLRSMPFSPAARDGGAAPTRVANARRQRLKHAIKWFAEGVPPPLSGIAPAGPPLMAAPTLKIDPFEARDTFDTGSGRAGIYRLVEARAAGPDQGRSAAVLDPRAAGIAACATATATSSPKHDVKNLASWTASRGVLAPGDRRRRNPLQARPASCCRTSPACPASSTWPRCAPP